MADLKQLARQIFLETLAAIDIPAAIERKLLREVSLLRCDDAECRWPLTSPGKSGGQAASGPPWEVGRHVLSGLSRLPDSGYLAAARLSKKRQRSAPPCTPFSCASRGTPRQCAAPARRWAASGLHG